MMKRTQQVKGKEKIVYSVNFTLWLSESQTFIAEMFSINNSTVFLKFLYQLYERELFLVFLKERKNCDAYSSCLRHNLLRFYIILFSWNQKIYEMQCINQARNRWEEDRKEIIKKRLNNFHKIKMLKKKLL